MDSAGERSFSYDRSRSAAREMFSLEASADWTGAVGQVDCFVYSLISRATHPEQGREQVLGLAERASDGRAPVCAVEHHAGRGYRGCG